MTIYDKWNKTMDVEGLRNDVEEIEENGGVGEYREVPVGKYEVMVEKMELRESKKGDPMFFAQFRILAGEYENSCLFMNQVITKGFQIGIVTEFLRSLDTDCEIKFVDYAQLNNLIMDVQEEIDGDKLEYLINYTSRKGFPKYTIEEIYS